MKVTAQTTKGSWHEAEVTLPADVGRCEYRWRLRWRTQVTRCCQNEFRWADSFAIWFPGGHGDIIEPFGAQCNSCGSYSAPRVSITKI